MPQKFDSSKKEKVEISKSQNFLFSAIKFLEPSFWVILKILGDFG